MCSIGEQSRRVGQKACRSFNQHEAEIEHDCDGITFIRRRGMVVRVIMTMIVARVRMPVHGPSCGRESRGKQGNVDIKARALLMRP